eukprot:symbB.v1.2.019142.t3/scaffold1553.1/size112120/4
MACRLRQRFDMAIFILEMGRLGGGSTTGSSFSWLTLGLSLGHGGQLTTMALCSQKELQPQIASYVDPSELMTYSTSTTQAAPWQPRDLALVLRKDGRDEVGSAAQKLQIIYAVCSSAHLMLEIRLLVVVARLTKVAVAWLAKLGVACTFSHTNLNEGSLQKGFQCQVHWTSLGPKWL